MAKKNKHKKDREGKQILQTLKGFGQDGAASISRLATTVRADLPTLVINQEARGPALKQSGNRISRFARKFMPRRDPGLMTPQGDSKGRKKLQKIARQIAVQNRPKRRRSRLPLVVVLFGALLAGGGYWAYKSVSLPTWNMSSYLDYNKWLNVVSGKARPDRSHSAEPTAVKSAVGGSKNSTAMHTSHKSSPVALKKAKSSRSVSKVKRSRASSKVSNAQKRKVWEQRIVKLKKKARKEYKQASYKYKKGSR